MSFNSVSSSRSFFSVCSIFISASRYFSLVPVKTWDIPIPVDASRIKNMNQRVLSTFLIFSILRLCGDQICDVTKRAGKFQRMEVEPELWQLPDQGKAVVFRGAVKCKPQGRGNMQFVNREYFSKRAG